MKSKSKYLIITIIMISLLVPVKADKPNTDSWDGLAYAVEYWFDNNLKDPGSLDMIKASKLVQVGNKNAYVQVVKYRAKNSFGGYTLEKRGFYIIKDDLDITPNEWRVKYTIRNP